MTREHRPGSPLAAGIVGLLVTAAYLIVWQVVVDQATCEETGMFACSGHGSAHRRLGALDAARRAPRADADRIEVLASTGG